MNQQSTAPRWVEPPQGKVVMIPIFRMGGIEMQARVEKWDPDPDSPWRAQIRNSVPGSGTWWRALFSGIPELRTIKGTITSSVSFTNGHGPGEFKVWADDEQKSFTWFLDPPYEFSIGQPVEIDYVQESGEYDDSVSGVVLIPGVVLEIRAAQPWRKFE